MPDRKPILFNVPQAQVSADDARASLESMQQAVKEAAEKLQAKVEEDRQRRQQLVDGISDKAMRRSLEKK